MPAQSADYGRIVNARHFERLVNYLRDGKIIHGGEQDAKDLFLAPTVLAERFAGVAGDAGGNFWADSAGAGI